MSNIKTEIQSVEKQLRVVSDQLARERQNSHKNDDSAILMELCTKKEILENRINELMEEARLINPNATKHLGKTYSLLINNVSRVVTLVNKYNADPLKNLISIDSPIGKAIVNSNQNESHVETPIGVIQFKLT